MSKKSYIKLLIIGELNQEYIIDLNGRAANRLPGGSLLYAAAGARMWNDDIGLIGRAGADYPARWFESFAKRNLDTSGILQLDRPFDIRKFYYWRDAEHCIIDNPVAGYAKYGLTFPHELLGYSADSSPATDLMWKNISPLLNPNFPHEYLDVSGTHICPINLVTQIKLVFMLQKNLINTITISPSNDYMNPNSWGPLSAVIKDISAFFPTEAQICSLFQGRTKDLWEMAEGLAAMGCPLIVIQRGEKGYWMYDSGAKKKMVIPFYPTRWVDPTGILDVFAGAFLGEYKRSYQPVQALIAGNASASLAVEGTGAFYCLDSLLGLETARREVLQAMIKTV